MISSKYKFLFIFVIHLITCSALFAQMQKVKVRPFADQKLFHLGFLVGIHAQDVIMNHTGFVNTNNEVCFAEIPSYTPGFSVGVIGDRYIN